MTQLRMPKPTPEALLEREKGFIRSAIERARDQLRDTQWPRDREKLKIKIVRLQAVLAKLEMPSKV